MSGNLEKDIDKVIDIILQTEKMSADILKSALSDFLKNKTQKKGQVSYGKLTQKFSGKLESIEVTDNNIKDFKQTAMKYNVDYSLKRDKSTSPPTYHVFFSTDKTENFKAAFTEYAHGVSEKNKQKKVEIPREKIQNLDSKLKENYNNANKDKERNRSTSLSR